MSQIFPRSANATARLTIAGALGFVILVGWVVWTLMFSSWVTKQNEVVEQPVHFCI
jgi:hypothetical protein